MLAFRPRAFFQNEDAGAFGGNETVALGVKGPAGALRIVVAGTEGAHHGKAGQAKLADAGLRTAGQHHVGDAVADGLQRLADGIVGRGASGSRG